MREAFERVGRGAVLNNTPYDLAAAVLCLERGRRGGHRRARRAARRPAAARLRARAPDVLRRGRQPRPARAHARWRPSIKGSAGCSDPPA